MTHPYDLSREDFFALPVDQQDGPWPLRSKHDPTGIVDEERRVWVPVLRDDGTWARRHVFSL